MIQPQVPAPAGRRVAFLDEWRGLCVLLMLFYHAVYDLLYIFNLPITWFHSPLMDFTQFFIAGGFIFIAGISGRFSRSNLKRGALVLGLGLAMTAATLLFMPAQAIRFGVLHCLGSCMILLGLSWRFLNKIPPLPGLCLCLLLYVLTRDVAAGYLSLGSFWSLQLPSFLYRSSYLFPLGFIGSGFFSADYFPLLPWLFWFLAGNYAGAFLKDKRAPAFLYRSHMPPLAAVGRRAMPIYILHQPVLYGLLWLILR